jgi:hypothetical protein
LEQLAELARRVESLEPVALEELDRTAALVGSVVLVALAESVVSVDSAAVLSADWAGSAVALVDWAADSAAAITKI